MTTPRARLRLIAGNDRDTGSVTVFVAITMVGLLVLVGLVADGGAKLRAAQRADAIAAEAARTAGQSIDLPTAVSSSDIRVDRQGAVAAANAYLTAAGATGTVTITPHGQSLQVTVTTSAPTVFLGLIGITTLTVTGHAQVTLVHGVTGGGT
jgi:hypothetical protein